MREFICRIKIDNMIYYKQVSGKNEMDVKEKILKRYSNAEIKIIKESKDESHMNLYALYPLKRSSLCWF